MWLLLYSKNKTIVMTMTEKPKDLEVRILRHGEKYPSTHSDPTLANRLTNEGREAAFAYGRELQRYDDTFLYTSLEDRAEETGAYVLAGILDVSEGERRAFVDQCLVSVRVGDVYAHRNGLNSYSMARHSDLAQVDLSLIPSAVSALKGKKIGREALMELCYAVLFYDPHHAKKDKRRPIADLRQQLVHGNDSELDNAEHLLPDDEVVALAAAATRYTFFARYLLTNSSSPLVQSRGEAPLAIGIGHDPNIGCALAQETRFSDDHDTYMPGGFERETNIEVIAPLSGIVGYSNKIFLKRDPILYHT